MLESLTPAQYRDWELYYLDEPWGPWRDNLHAAIIAREIARPNLRRGAKLELSTFMYQRQETAAAERVDEFMTALAAMSVPAMTKADRKAAKRAAAKARKTGSPK